MAEGKLEVGDLVRLNVKMLQAVVNKLEGTSKVVEVTAIVEDPIMLGVKLLTVVEPK